MPYDGSELSETARHLIAAKAMLAQRGWCPKGARGAGGSVCVVVAIYEAAGLGYIPALKIMQRVVGPYVPVWNDTPGRTREEVDDALDCGIALAIADTLT